MSILHKFETLKRDFLDSLDNESYKLLEKLAYYSSCILDFIFRHPEELFYIKESLNKPLLGRQTLINEALALKDIPKDDEFITKLTFFKMKHFSRIVAKDIYKKHHLIELTQEYSYLADASFEVAYQRAFEKYKNRFGNPIDETTGKIATGSVIALGKHGGTDLNYYSDVDVIYIYSGEGNTEKGISNREFFIKVFTDTTVYLTKRNLETVAWNVDLDLRPEGKKGLLAYSIPFLENYYWSVGRTWERHMLIKARHAAGDENITKEFLSIITPFVYRKSLSKDIIDEIFNMKKMIEEHSKPKNPDEIDIKKCEGGIREIEFIVQVFQLLHGGYDVELRERETVKALRKITEKGLISKQNGEILENAYIFLRNLEHVIQLKNCVQTQIMSLKKVSEYADKLGFKSDKEFLETFEYYRKEVKRIFNSLGGESIELSPLQHFVISKQEEEALNFLTQIGFKDSQWALNLIDSIFKNENYALLPEKDKKILIDFLPTLEKYLKTCPDKESFLVNLVKLFTEGNIYRVLISAIQEKSKLVDFIIEVAQTSDYVSNIMAKDKEIIDLAFLTGRPLGDREDFEKELKIINLENKVDALKKLKKVVEVLASLEYLAKIKTHSPIARLKKLNNTITNLADFILENLYKINEGKGFAIYGLGKLGSKEMNIGSDLDLIFVFKNEESKFNYLKIPQNIVKDLTSYTKEGQLYQLDLRLRPYGKAGELSPSLEFYKKYFENEARPWEVLAWIKSRFIYGDEEVKEAFESIINNFLFNREISRDIKEDLLDMRLKLEGLTKETENEIDIKLGKGGIADIEFMVQLYYLQTKQRKTSILEGLLDLNPDIVDDYIFLREVETRLRLVKGSSSSKISKFDKQTERIINSFNLNNNDFFSYIKNSKNRIRREFYKFFTK